MNLTQALKQPYKKMKKNCLYILSFLLLLFMQAERLQGQQDLYDLQDQHDQSPEHEQMAETTEEELQGWMSMAIAMAEHDPDLQKEARKEMARINSLTGEAREKAFERIGNLIHGYKTNRKVSDAMGVVVEQEFTTIVYVDGIPVVSGLIKGVSKKQALKAENAVNIVYSFTHKEDNSLSLEILIENAPTAICEKYGIAREGMQQVASREKNSSNLTGNAEVLKPENYQMIVNSSNNIRSGIIGGEGVEEEPDALPATTLEAYWKETAKEIFLSSGQQVFGLMYCKECDEASETFVEKRKSLLEREIKVGKKKCFVSIFLVNEKGELGVRNEYRKLDVLSVNSNNNDIHNDNFQSELISLNRFKDGQALVAIGGDNVDQYKSWPCTNYIDESVKPLNFCSDDFIENETFLNSLFESLRQCVEEMKKLVPAGGWEYDPAITQAVGNIFKKPLSEQNENIQVLIVKGDDQQELKSGDFAGTDYNFSLSLVWDEQSKQWKVSLRTSPEYLKSLGYSDPDILSKLAGILDELMRKSRVNLCVASELNKDCVREMLNNLQVLNINLQHIGKEGKIHPSMWSSSGGVRDLLPPSAKWTPVEGGVVDGLAEAVLDIPMLIKTIGEIIAEPEQGQALLNVFSEEGMVQVRDAVVSEIGATLRDCIEGSGEKCHYFTSKAAVGLLLFFVTIEGKTASSLSDAAAEAAKLTKKLEGAPTLQRYFTKLSKEGEDGLAKGKKLDGLLGKVDLAKLEALVARVDKGKLDDLLADLADNHLLTRKLLDEPHLVDAWERLAKLGRNQMRKDPDILSAMRKTMDNPDIPSNRLDDIVNSLAKSGARCKTCDNAGTNGLRYIDEVLEDLGGFATEFKKTPGYDDFLREMGEQGTKATGGSWTLEALMRNRSKYFSGETITGFEVKHVPGRDFAADVRTKVGSVLSFKEFKNWSSNLMGQSNMIEQMTGTMSVIDELDQMKFIFNPSRWVPTASQFKTALNGKKGLIDAMSDAKKTQLFGTTSADEIINILSSEEVFELIIKVQ